MIETVISNSPRHMVSVSCPYELLVLLTSLWALGGWGAGGVDIRNQAEGLHGGEGEGQRVSGRSSSRSLGGRGAFWKRKSGLRLPS